MSSAVILSISLAITPVSCNLIYVNVWFADSCTGSSDTTIAVNESDICFFNPTAGMSTPAEEGPYIVHQEVNSWNGKACLNPAQVEKLAAEDCATATTDYNYGDIIVGQAVNWTGAYEPTEYYIMAWRFRDGAPSCLTDAVNAVDPNDAAISELNTTTRRRRTHRDYFINMASNAPCSTYDMPEGIDELQRAGEWFPIELDHGPPPVGDLISKQTLICWLVGLGVFGLTMIFGKQCVPEVLQSQAKVYEQIKAEFDKEAASLEMTPGSIGKMTVSNCHRVLKVYYLLAAACVVSILTYKAYIAMFPMQCTGCYELLRCSCDVPWRACDVPKAATNGILAGEWKEMCNLPDPHCWNCDSMGCKRQDDGSLNFNECNEGRKDSCQGDVCIWGEDESMKHTDYAWGGHGVTRPDSCWEPPSFVEVECPTFDDDAALYIAHQLASYTTIADIYPQIANLISMFFFVPMVVFTYSYFQEVLQENPVGDPTAAFIEKAKDKKKAADRAGSNSFVEAAKCKCCTPGGCKRAHDNMVERTTPCCCRVLECFFCTKWVVKRRPCHRKLHKLGFLLLYVLTKMFVVKLNLLNVGAPPIITHTIDNCHNATASSISIYGIAGTSDYVKVPPKCSPDTASWLSWPTGFIKVGVPTFALPVLDFAFLLPIVSLPCLFTLTVAPFWKLFYVKVFWAPPKADRVELPEDKERSFKEKAKAWLIGEAERRVRKKIIDETRPRAVRFMEEKFGLSNERAVKEWGACIEPLLQKVDPRNLPAVVAVIPDTVEARILLALKEKVQDALQKPPYNFDARFTGYAWELILKHWELIRDPFQLEFPDSIDVDPLTLIKTGLSGDIGNFIQYFIPEIKLPDEVKAAMREKMKGFAQKSVKKMTAKTGKPVKAGQVAPAPEEKAGAKKK